MDTSPLFVGVYANQATVLLVNANELLVSNVAEPESPPITTGLLKLDPGGVFVSMIVTVSTEGGTSTPGATGLDNVTLNVWLLCTRPFGRIGTKM